MPLCVPPMMSTVRTVGFGRSDVSCAAGTEKRITCHGAFMMRSTQNHVSPHPTWLICANPQQQHTEVSNRSLQTPPTNSQEWEHEAYLPSNRHDLGGRRKCRYKQAFYCLATACLLFILLPRCLLLLLIVLWVTTVTRVITICIVTCILILMGRRLLPMIHPSLLWLVLSLRLLWLLSRLLLLLFLLVLLLLLLLFLVWVLLLFFTVVAIVDTTNKSCDCEIYCDYC